VACDLTRPGRDITNLRKENQHVALTELMAVRYKVVVKRKFISWLTWHYSVVCADNTTLNAHVKTQNWVKQWV